MHVRRGRPVLVLRPRPNPALLALHGMHCTRMDPCPLAPPPRHPPPPPGRQMCILAGCDFLPNLPGLGIKKAHLLMRKHRDFVKVSSCSVAWSLSCCWRAGLGEGAKATNAQNGTPQLQLGKHGRNQVGQLPITPRQPYCARPPRPPPGPAPS